MGNFVFAGLGAICLLALTDRLNRRESTRPLNGQGPPRLRGQIPGSVGLEGGVAVPEDPAVVAAVPGWAGTRKIAGVLSELVTAELSGGRAHGRLAPDEVPAGRDEAPMVILGIGVNIAQEADDLPVAWAGSLRTLGAVDVDGKPAHAAVAEVVLDGIGRQLVRRLEQWEEACGDVDAGDGVLGSELRAALTTLGQQVSVQAPGGELNGLAIDVTPALVLRNQAGDTEVRAGDVSLVRVTG